MQQVPINLGLDEDQVDEQDHEVVLDILVAEAAAVPAHREPDVMPARFVAGARILRPQRLDGVPAFNAHRHCSGGKSLAGTSPLLARLVGSSGKIVSGRGDLIRSALCKAWSL